MPAPAPKRHKLTNTKQVEEITFDPQARQEYLTGFHKRKQERIQNARDTAAKRAREERIKERAQIREQRKEDLEKHVSAVQEELRKQNPDANSDVEANGVEGEDVEWDGMEDAAVVEDVQQDEDFVDEEKYTTVTVEAMDASGEDSEDGKARDRDSAAKRKLNGDAGTVLKKKRLLSKASKPKKKKKTFRYESKAERQAGRQKLKSKNAAAKAKRIGK